MAHWLDFLQPFDFEIIHRTETAHGNADGLSRIDTERCKKKSCYCHSLQEFSCDHPVIIETVKEKVDENTQVSLSPPYCPIKCQAVHQEFFIKS